MKVQFIQHVPFETPGALEDWCQTGGHVRSCTRVYAGDSWPDPALFDLLVVLGGPMNVYESAKYPFLTAEIRFLSQVIGEDKKVLGICLGAQLLAVALGARVTAAPCKEIGWFPVNPLRLEGSPGVFDHLADPFHAFHWHGDMFLIPPGAGRIASSTACANQAFQYRQQVLGIQFHLETNQDSLENMIIHCGQELVHAPFIQDADTLRRKSTHIPAMRANLFQLLDTFTGAVNPAVPTS